MKWILAHMVLLFVSLSCAALAASDVFRDNDTLLVIKGITLLAFVITWPGALVCYNVAHRDAARWLRLAAAAYLVLTGVFVAWFTIGLIGTLFTGWRWPR